MYARTEIGWLIVGACGVLSVLGCGDGGEAVENSERAPQKVRVFAAEQREITEYPGASSEVVAETVPAGQDFKYTLKTLGRLATADEFAEIVIKTGDDGQIIKLSGVVTDRQQTEDGNDYGGIDFFQRRQFVDAQPRTQRFASATEGRAT